MNADDQAFARSLARLRPAKAKLEPDVLLYQAGLAAGRAEAKSRERLFLRIAALAALTVGLAAGGGFYAGHRQGERAGYLAAVQPIETEQVASEPVLIAPPVSAPQPPVTAEQPVTSEQPETKSQENSAVPQPPAPSSDSRLAAAEPFLWQRLLEPFDSPLAIRTTAKQWEDLSDFRPPRKRAPRTETAPISYPDLPDLVEPPRRMPTTHSWYRSITNTWGLCGH